MNRTGLIATKLGNSSFYDSNGIPIHVTILRVEDCIVSKVKTQDKDGYNALQLVSIDTNKDINKFNEETLRPGQIIKIAIRAF